MVVTAFGQTGCGRATRAIPVKLSAISSVLDLAERRKGGGRCTAQVEVGVAGAVDEVTVVSLRRSTRGASFGNTVGDGSGGRARDVRAGERILVGWALPAPLDVGVAVDEVKVVSLRRSTRGA